MIIRNPKQKDNSTNFPKIAEIKKAINESYRKQEPAELIFAEIETLPDKKIRANICRELAQKYWAQNTRIGHDLSIKFAKLAKQFDELNI